MNTVCGHTLRTRSDAALLLQQMGMLLPDDQPDSLRELFLQGHYRIWINPSLADLIIQKVKIGNEDKDPETLTDLDAKLFRIGKTGSLVPLPVLDHRDASSAHLGFD